MPPAVLNVVAVTVETLPCVKSVGAFVALRFSVLLDGACTSSDYFVSTHQD